MMTDGRQVMAKLYTEGALPSAGQSTRHLSVCCFCTDEVAGQQCSSPTSTASPIPIGCRSADNRKAPVVGGVALARDVARLLEAGLPEEEQATLDQLSARARDGKSAYFQHVQGSTTLCFTALITCVLSILVNPCNACQHWTGLCRNDHVHVHTPTPDPCCGQCSMTAPRSAPMQARRTPA